MAKVKVKNRSAGNVVYKVDDLKVRRDFLPGEVKMVDVDELNQLSYSQGGRLLISQYLQILDEPVRDEIEGEVEPEYNFSEDDVKNLILTGSLDAFLDALDFAPAGVIDLIKKFSVSLPMADIRKMNAMKEKLGFDVMAAIDNSAEETEVVEEAKPTRRVQPTEEKKTGGRRTTPKPKNTSSKK